MNICDTLIPFFLAAGGLSFHIFWHLGAAIGTYVIILHCEVVRAEALGHAVALAWVWGIIPVVAATSLADAPPATRTRSRSRSRSQLQFPSTSKR
jgi:hypothetical protein